MNVNIKQIIFLQRQIRKYLSLKNNKNTVFIRPPQPKAKNNYLLLNSENDENKDPNENINNLPFSNKIESNENLENYVNNENNQDEKETNQNNKDEDSLLNSEIKYVENLRIQNATYTGEILNGKRHGKGIQKWDDGAKYEGNWEMINQMDMVHFIIQMEMYIKDIGKIIELMVKEYI